MSSSSSIGINNSFHCLVNICCHFQAGLSIMLRRISTKLWLWKLNLVPPMEHTSEQEHPDSLVSLLFYILDFPLSTMNSDCSFLDSAVRLLKSILYEGKLTVEWIPPPQNILYILLHHPWDIQKIFIEPIQMTRRCWSHISWVRVQTRSLGQETLKPRHSIRPQVRLIDLSPVCKLEFFAELGKICEYKFSRVCFLCYREVYDVIWYDVAAGDNKWLSCLVER